MAAWVKCFATISMPFTLRQRQLFYLLYPSVAELLSSSGKESQKHEIGKTQLNETLVSRYKTFCLYVRNLNFQLAIIWKVAQHSSIWMPP